MLYSICFLDNRGLTRRTEFGAFDDDTAASNYARGETPPDAIAEVWNQKLFLVTRLFRDRAGLFADAGTAARNGLEVAS